MINIIQIDRLTGMVYNKNAQTRWKSVVNMYQIEIARAMEIT